MTTPRAMPLDHSSNTTPFGIKSLDKIEMPTLKKLVSNLKNADQLKSDTDESILALFHGVDKEYKEIKKNMEQIKNNQADEIKALESQKQQNTADNQKTEIENEVKNNTDVNMTETKNENTEKDKEAKNSEEIDSLNKKIEELTEELKKSQRNLEETEERGREMDNFCSKQVNQISSLKKQIEQLNRLHEEKEKKLNHQIDDLKLRLSQVAGSKLSDNNPSITDLSDPNRPQKIAEQFSELYDNEWTDALEVLLSSGNERESIDKLVDALKACFEYCKDVAEKQMNDLSCVLCLCREDSCGYGYKDLNKEVIKALKDIRKLTGLEEYSVISLQKEFKETEVFKQLKDNTDQFNKYIDTCLKCAWLSNVQNPPICLDFDIQPSSEYDTNYTKEYTTSGKYVDYLVWPCMLRCDNGPLLMKGVVQCTGADDEEGAKDSTSQNGKAKEPNENQDGEKEEDRKIDNEQNNQQAEDRQIDNEQNEQQTEDSKIDSEQKEQQTEEETKDKDPTTLGEPVLESVKDNNEKNDNTEERSSSQEQSQIKETATLNGTTTQDGQ